MPTVSMRQLLEAGVHFGHQTRRWNPKMRRYIFAERNGIHIIDLAQTVKRLDDALDFVRETVAAGDSVLFVGTKKQAQEPIAEEATRAEMPYVNQRWLGGMLTNFVTIRKRLGLLDQLEARQRERRVRAAVQEGSRPADRRDEQARSAPSAASARCAACRAPCSSSTRSASTSPWPRRASWRSRSSAPATRTSIRTMLDYVIPANDDAIRAIRLLCRLVADAAIEGAQERAARPADEPMAPWSRKQEEASDEMVAALAAGGTFSFEPEPDEDELLPVEAELPRSRSRRSGGDDPHADAARGSTCRSTPMSRRRQSLTDGARTQRQTDDRRFTQ